MAKQVKKLQTKGRKPPKVVDWGKKITVPGEAVDLKTLVTGYKAGAFPMAQPGVNFDLDLKDFTEDHFDLPDVDQFRRMDIIDQQQVLANLDGLKRGIDSKIATAKQQLEAEYKVQTGDDAPVVTPGVDPKKKHDMDDSKPAAE